MSGHRPRRSKILSRPSPERATEPPASDEPEMEVDVRAAVTGAAGRTIHISNDRLNTLHPALLALAFHHTAGPVYADDGGVVLSHS